MDPLPTTADFVPPRPEATSAHGRHEYTAAQLAEQIAERLRAEETLRVYASRLEHLQQIRLAILSADSLTAIISTAVGFIEEAVPCLAAGISLYDPQRTEVSVVSSSHDHLPTGARLPITVADALAAMKRGDIYVFPDAQALAEASPGLGRIAEMGGRSVLAVPIRAGQTLVALLWIAAAEPRPFTTEEATIAREVCDLVAVAIQNRQLLEAEQKARQRERSLREVGASLTLGLDRDEVLRRILDQLERLIPFSSAAIVLLDNWRLVFTARREVSVAQRQLNTLHDHHFPNLQRVIDTCRPYLIDDTTTADDWARLPGFDYIRAWLGVPLLIKGDCIGALTIDRDQPHSFTAEDVELALAFANQAAVAIDNARLFNEVQSHAERLDARVRERTRELKALYGITAVAIENPDLDVVLARALELAVEAIACAGGAIYLVQSGQPGLRAACRVGRGESGPLDEAPADTLLGRLAPEGAPLDRRRRVAARPVHRGHAGRGRRPFARPRP